MSYDCLGKELREGDAVVCIVPYHRYLVFGIVSKVTKQGATIRYKNKVGLDEYVSRLSNMIKKV